ncbi:MAG: UvrB/UvrC motif-containing protein [Devosia sp.]
MSLQSIHRKIDELVKEMAEAANAEDFERAGRIRDEIERLKGATVRKPPPGEMGLGTHVPVIAPPAGWKRPRKPNPMTTNVKPRGGR